MRIDFALDGEQQSVEAEPDTPLLWVLRDQLQRPGTKYGCGRALCGACTVHVDGGAVRSCAFPIRYAAGRQVRTIEGLAADAVGRAVMQAWIDLDVVQCGWCQPGQILAAAALLSRGGRVDDAAIDASLAGNLCRCGTYPRIRAAVKRAAGALGREVDG